MLIEDAEMHLLRARGGNARGSCIWIARRAAEARAAAEIQGPVRCFDLTCLLVTRSHGSESATRFLACQRCWSFSSFRRAHLASQSSLRRRTLSDCKRSPPFVNRGRRGTWVVPDTFTFPTKKTKEPNVYRLTLFKSSKHKAEYMEAALIETIGIEATKANEIAKQAQQQRPRPRRAWVVLAAMAVVVVELPMELSLRYTSGAHPATWHRSGVSLAPRAAHHRLLGVGPVVTLRAVRAAALSHRQHPTWWQPQFPGSGRGWHASQPAV